MAVHSLTSPALSHPGGNAAVQYSYKINTEPGFDPVTVQWSSDGQAWNTIGSVNGRNATYPDYTAKKDTFVAFTEPLDSRPLLPIVSCPSNVAQVVTRTLMRRISGNRKFKLASSSACDS